MEGESNMKTEASALVLKIKQLEQLVKQQLADLAKMQKERDEAIHALKHYETEQVAFQTKIKATRAEKEKGIQFQRTVFQVLEEQKSVMGMTEKQLTELNYLHEKLQKAHAILVGEVKRKDLELTQLTERYERLNNTKIIKFMRKYWGLKKKRVKGIEVNEKLES